MNQRTIKFRAWNGKTMDYEPWFGEYAGGGAPVNGFEHDRRTFMQFTGLLDKNGKEIYEHDIIRSTERDDVIEVGEIFPLTRHIADYGQRIGFYMDGKYNKIIPQYDDTYGDWVSNPEFYEVIGNIYESPDLTPSPTQSNG